MNMFMYFHHAAKASCEQSVLCVVFTMAAGSISIMQDQDFPSNCVRGELRWSLYFLSLQLYTRIAYKYIWLTTRPIQGTINTQHAQRMAHHDPEQKAHGELVVTVGTASRVEANDDYEGWTGDKQQPTFTLQQEFSGTRMMSIIRQYLSIWDTSSGTWQHTLQWDTHHIKPLFMSHWGATRFFEIGVYSEDNGCNVHEGVFTCTALFDIKAAYDWRTKLIYITALFKMNNQMLCLGLSLFFLWIKWSSGNDLLVCRDNAYIIFKGFQPRFIRSSESTWAHDFTLSLSANPGGTRVIMSGQQQPSIGFTTPRLRFTRVLYMLMTWSMMESQLRC